MKTLKTAVILALTTAGIVVSAFAADAVLSPRAAANAPQVTASSGHDHSAAAPGKTAGADAKAHCKMAKKDGGRMSCCK